VSHHISGPRAVAEPIADITDFYAFPSPDRPGHLVLVLNTLPFAPPTARFSDALLYRFRIRELTRNDPDAGSPFNPAKDDIVIDCVFSTPEPDDRGGQHCTLRLPSGDTVTARVGGDRDTAGNGTRIFAGPRWDPFILDAPARRSRPRRWRSPTPARSTSTARTSSVSWSSSTARTCSETSTWLASPPRR
jgi:hypothetical protein